MKRIFICILCLGLMPYESKAQKINQKYQVVLKDGNRLNGTLLEINKVYWIIKTESLGIIEIPISEVSSFKIINEVASPEKNLDEEKPFNPVPERYLFLPSAYSLEARNGTFHSNSLFFMGVQYGFTKQFSAGISSFILPISFILSNIYLKYNQPIAHNLQVALQLNNLIFYEASFPISSILQNPNLLFTLGAKHKNLTFGGGILFTPFLSQNNGSIFMNNFQLSFIFPLNWRTFLLSQNAFWQSETFSIFLPSIAIRLVRKNRIFDFGTMLYSVKDGRVRDELPLPFFGLQFTFGKRRNKEFRLKQQNDTSN